MDFWHHFLLVSKKVTTFFSDSIQATKNKGRQRSCLSEGKRTQGGSYSIVVGWGVRGEMRMGEGGPGGGLGLVPGESITS